MLRTARTLRTGSQEPFAPQEIFDFAIAFRWYARTLCQSNTLVLFRGSKADIDTLSIPATEKKELLGLTVGNALVYCPGNLPTKNASEIRIYPPRFLHVNPLKATTLFLEGQIKKYKL